MEEQTIPMTPEIAGRMFDAFTNHLKAAADILVQMIGPTVNLPAAAKGRYIAIDKLQEAHMWAGNGMQALVQALVAGTPTQLDPNAPPALSVVEGGKVS